MPMKNAPSSEITICGRTYDEYIDMIKAPFAKLLHVFRMPFSF
jgi:hypothetical protein